MLVAIAFGKVRGFVAKKLRSTPSMSATRGSWQILIFLALSQIVCYDRTNEQLELREAQISTRSYVIKAKSDLRSAACAHSGSRVGKVQDVDLSVPICSLLSLLGLSRFRFLFFFVSLSLVRGPQGTFSKRVRDIIRNFSVGQEKNQ